MQTLGSLTAGACAPTCSKEVLRASIPGDRDDGDTSLPQVHSAEKDMRDSVGWTEAHRSR